MGISASCPVTHPLLSSLQVGELWYRTGQETHYLAVAFGFAEVLPDRVTVLAQIAERAQDIDIARAESAKKRAEERVTRPQPEMDFERARVRAAEGTDAFAGGVARTHPRITGYKRGGSAVPPHPVLSAA
jgi:F0F1-type ATP synthase epsilon subunit